MKIRALIELLEQAAKEHGEDVEVGIDDADTRVWEDHGWALDILALDAHDGYLLLSGEYGCQLDEAQSPSEAEPAPEQAPAAPSMYHDLPAPRPLWG